MGIHRRVPGHDCHLRIVRHHPWSLHLTSTPVRQPFPRYDPRLSPRSPDPPSPSRRHFVAIVPALHAAYRVDTPIKYILRDPISLALPAPSFLHSFHPSPSPAPAFHISTPASSPFVSRLAVRHTPSPSSDHPIRSHVLHSDPDYAHPQIRSYPSHSLRPRVYRRARETLLFPYPPPPLFPSPGPLSRRPLLAPPSTARIPASSFPFLFPPLCPAIILLTSPRFRFRFPLSSPPFPSSYTRPSPPLLVVSRYPSHTSAEVRALMWGTPGQGALCSFCGGRDVSRWRHACLCARGIMGASASKVVMRREARCRGAIWQCGAGGLLGAVQRAGVGGGCVLHEELIGRAMCGEVAALRIATRPGIALFGGPGRGTESGELREVFFEDCAPRVGSSFCIAVIELERGGRPWKMTCVRRSLRAAIGRGDYAGTSPPCGGTACVRCSSERRVGCVACLVG
ncbi:hypothetical protein C8R44DRAFT_388573 [Mycena epipterygia]|nr:hypothetical protein C8R44DRAFT_388573 [Mycena epipterygia]